MIKIAVVDDDEAMTSKLKRVVNDFYEQEKREHILKIYNMPGELLWDLEEGRYYDIYFLDIEMSVSGLELARNIRLKYEEPYIVFVTAYMKYCIQGYEYNAYRYITKDCMDEKIPLVLENMTQRIAASQKKFYYIENYSDISKIAYDNIYYLCIEGKYTYLYTSNNTYRVRKPLKTVYAELNSKEFIYVDKSCVVNLRHVLELENNCVVMRNQAEIQVSIPQYQNVKKAISNYWRNEK